jgi:ferric-dicitrate binding protein FerR (iron transport regulator)
VAVEEGVVVVEPRPEPTGPISSMLSTIRSLKGDARPINRMRPMNVRGGQEIAVGRPEYDLQLLPIEPAQVSSWREGRLRFAREPLQSVISSIRGVSTQEIELADPELGELRFTGTVFSNGVDTWVNALPAIFPVTVRQDGARLIIARRVEPRG